MCGARRCRPDTRRNLVPVDEFGKAIDRIVMRTLQNNPGQRYPSLNDLAADIERLLKGGTAVAVVPEQTVYRVQPSTGGDLETGTGITTGENLSPITGSVTPAISPRWRGVKQGLFALVGTIPFYPCSDDPRTNRHYSDAGANGHTGIDDLWQPAPCRLCTVFRIGRKGDTFTPIHP